MTVEELFTAFKNEALDVNIDTEDRYCWDSLAFGFAIGKGASRAMAFHLALRWCDFYDGDMTMEQIVEDYDPHVFDN